MTAFPTAYAWVRNLTLISEDRMQLLWDEATNAPPGHFAEVGVYKGGSALLLRLAGPDRTLHLFDTFTGHPWSDDAEQWQGRFADTDQPSVAIHVDGEYWPGVFPLSIPPNWAPRLALVHVDADLYRSTMDALVILGRLLVPNGVMICDDYGFCPGAKRAVDEYAAVNPTLTLTTPATGQAVLRKQA